MTAFDNALVFVYHLGWCFAAAVGIAWLWAQNVATQTTVLQNPMTGTEQRTHHVDRDQLRQTWLWGTLGWTVVFLVALIMWEVKGMMENMGLVG